mmetsp:Transcript_88940/g.252153  ORF Transcript_88940/g.252153 Transcript_88940/m.252153 type:complete len:235 (+) Transcript_88940:918-1622(+)
MLRHELGRVRGWLDPDQCREGTLREEEAEAHEHHEDDQDRPDQAPHAAHEREDHDAELAEPAVLPDDGRDLHKLEQAQDAEQRQYADRDPEVGVRPLVRVPMVAVHLQHICENHIHVEQAPEVESLQDVASARSQPHRQVNYKEGAQYVRGHDEVQLVAYASGVLGLVASCRICSVLRLTRHEHHIQNYQDGAQKLVLRPPRQPPQLRSLERPVPLNLCLLAREYVHLLECDGP